VQATWSKDVWDVAKVAVPWVTGGLAGSVLAYLLAQRTARKSRARLLVKTSTVRFSLPTVDSGLKTIQVRYGDEVFEALLLYELTVKNISTRTASAASFLLQFHDPIRIVDDHKLVQPINRQTTLSHQESSTGEAYLWDLGELKPTDSARLRLLLSPATLIKETFRGDDNVDVISDTIRSPASSDRHIMMVVAWIALYVALGFIPFLSAIFRGLLIWVSIPFAVDLIDQVKRLFFAPRNHIQIGEIRAEEVRIDAGMGGVQK
jgi:hypothetical protein